jgi:hypothetical protein
MEGELGIIFVGNKTDSRHTMASLLRLRRCISAASFSRSYTESGIFFSVNVVGTIFSIHNGTIMVPLGLSLIS